MTNCPIAREETWCRTCKHYDSIHDRVQDEHGVCRRHAPKPNFSDNPAAIDLLYAQWPMVRFNDYCGEWQWDEKIDCWIDDLTQNPQ